MHSSTPELTDTGLDVLDLADDLSFNLRRLHTRDVISQMEGLRRLTQAFVESPDTILQVLVDSAVQLCGADSAGISLERSRPGAAGCAGDANGDLEAYEWVATSGEYAGFLNARLPRHPSACGTCLERGAPQLFRVRKQFFETMGIEAALVTDGILLPWQVEEIRGTIWIMAHHRAEAFDREDLRMMQLLSDFAAMAMRQQRLQRLLLESASAAAAAAMANHLAHEINNPLQSLTNLVFLATETESPLSARQLGEQLPPPLLRLSDEVQRLLALPKTHDRPTPSS